MATFIFVQFCANHSLEASLNREEKINNIFNGCGTVVDSVCGRMSWDIMRGIGIVKHGGTLKDLKISVFFRTKKIKK